LALGAGLAAWGVRLLDAAAESGPAAGAVERGAVADAPTELVDSWQGARSGTSVSDEAADKRAALRDTPGPGAIGGQEAPGQGHIRGRILGSDGAPVAGARVLLGGPGSRAHPLSLEAELAEGAPGVQEMMSAASGHFEFSGPVPVPGIEDQLRLTVVAPGWARSEERRAVSEMPDGDWGVVRLVPGVILNGRVLDHLGRPVPDARLELLHKRRGPFEKLAPGIPVASSAADGSFRVDTVAPGPWELQAVSKRHPSGSASGTTSQAGEQVNGIEIVLVEALALEGRLLGIPPGQGADLEVYGRPAGGGSGGFEEMAADARDRSLAPRTAPIAPSGDFLLEGLRADRRWLLHARLGGADNNHQGSGGSGDARRSFTVEVAAGETSAELQWLAVASISGRVLDGVSGEPVVEFKVGGLAAQRRVFARAPAGDAAGGSEHADGRFRLGGLRPRRAGAPVELRVDALGYEPFERKGIELDPGAELDLGELRLNPVGVVRVTVTDVESGEPLAGSLVKLSPADSPGVQVFGELGPGQEASWRRVSRGTTDGAGQVELSSFPGRVCEVAVTAAEYAPGGLDSLLLPATGLTEVQVELGRGGAVHVMVRDSAGAPLAGREVTGRLANSDGGSSTLFSVNWEHGQSDGAGLAKFSHLAPGEYEFRLERAAAGAFTLTQYLDSAGDDSAWVRVTVVSGETASIVLQEQQSGSLVGVVTEAGKPLVGALVSMRRESAGGAAFFMPGIGGHEARTDAGGAFSLGQLEPGAWALEVRHATRAMVTRRSVEVMLGEHRIDLDLEVSILRGRVTDMAGRGLADMLVTVAEVGRDRQRAVFSISTSSGDADGGLHFASSDGGVEPVRSAPDGSYQLRGVLPGPPLVVSASGGSWIAASLEEVSVEVGRTRDLPDLRLEEGGTLEVRLVLSDGQAAGPAFVSGKRILDVEGAEVTAGGEQNRCHGLVQDGHLTLGGLAPGRWLLEFNRMAFNGGELAPREEDVRAGETQEVLVTVP
ncbi:MAG: carboxypeptidase regulatory-like domain-containing protein, partial [Planctomycetota bacterium]|nr:carboxypeptidase regulatory-like domain-containing protein [Planctomycetota bacterium]